MLKKCDHGCEHKSISTIKVIYEYIPLARLDKSKHIFLKGAGDMVVRHTHLYDTALLCVQDIKRLLFNFLRISPSYWSVCSNPKKIRLRKHMPIEQRNTVLCHRRYGDVFANSYQGWSDLNPKLLVSHVGPALALYSSNDVHQIKDGDMFAHLPQSAPLPTQAQWLDMLEQLRRQRKADSLIEKLKVRISSLWKILNLVYTRALHPDIEQWRVGALVQLVKDFAGKLDPWAARSKSGDEHMRRHMNIMVHRWLDRGAIIAENAAHDLFPNDQGSISKQIQFDFEDRDFVGRLFSLGNEEAAFVRDRVLVA